MPILSDKALKRIKEGVAPAYQAVMNLLPARAHVVADYFRVYQRLPDLQNPKTFGEKIVARKLFDRDPRLPDLVDKLKVKEIVSKKFGERFVIPTLGSWSSAAGMDFTKAPLAHAPYVLKTNHASGTNVFVKPGDGSLQPEKIRRKMAKFLTINHADIAEEWAYSQIERKIFAEPYLEMPEGYLADYKFHVFGGKIYVTEVVLDRFRNYGVGFYDRDWQLLDIGYVKRYPRYRGLIPAPSRLKDMMGLAEALGADFPYVRVDLYQIGEEVKLGELTFYPGAGHDKFSNPAWDEKFGQQWK